MSTADLFERLIWLFAIFDATKRFSLSSPLRLETALDCRHTPPAHVRRPAAAATIR